MPFSKARRPTLVTTFSVRGAGESGMNGSGFGMLPTFSMPARIHRSASSGVSTSSRSTSG